MSWDPIVFSAGMVVGAAVFAGSMYLRMRYLP